MTVGSRRLAASCRERLATDPTILTGAAAPDQLEPQATVDISEVETVVPLENVDATVT
ncbi:MAG: hypothetical protein WBA97_06610 [Actinophytocola sp.]|uniref:hypothetical protein n=1 Tax=Actinophytocola sp. TaxID=1872138 RepID=UPI003C755A5D